MNAFLKNLFGTPAALLALLPLMLAVISESAKNRDDNSTGNDDAFGKILDAIAPAAIAFQSRDDLKMDKALLALEETIARYRASRTPKVATV